MTPQPPCRFYSDGRSIWFIETLWAAMTGLPATPLELQSVAELDQVVWFSEAWGKRPTCRLVVEHCRRMMAADLTYPVLLSPEGVVLDGMHRICKAMATGLTTISAVRLTSMPPPDERLHANDPRYEAAPQSD